MTDEKRLIMALRGELYMGIWNLYFHVPNKFNHWSDEEVLEVTDGTLLRKRVELSLAWQDLWVEIRPLYERPALWCLNELLRIINWIKGG